MLLPCSLPACYLSGSSSSSSSSSSLLLTPSSPSLSMVRRPRCSLVLRTSPPPPLVSPATINLIMLRLGPFLSSMAAHHASFSFYTPPFRRERIHMANPEWRRLGTKQQPVVSLHCLPHLPFPPIFEHSCSLGHGPKKKNRGARPLERFFHLS